MKRTALQRSPLKGKKPAWNPHLRWPRSKPIAKHGGRAAREKQALTAFREAVRARCHVGNGFYRCERCLYCVVLSKFEAHHKRSRAQGGAHNPETNGAGLCKGPETNDCHGRLHAGLLPDAARWLNTKKPQGGSR